jgi:hypothetical protein
MKNIISALSFVAGLTILAVAFGRPVGPVAEALAPMATEVQQAAKAAPAFYQIAEQTITANVPSRKAMARTVETDAAHAARLLRSHMTCGEVYENYVGGRNSDCTL